MKVINKLFIFLLAVAALASCEYDSYSEEAALSGIETQDPFVRFDNSLTGGVAVEEDTMAVVETSIRVEFTFPIETDVTIDYSLKGTATFGEDYEIDGATAQGGSITISHDPAALAISSAQLVISVLPDMIAEGGETIEIELTGATAADNTTLNVGQGPLHGAVTVNIADAQ